MVFGTSDISSPHDSPTFGKDGSFEVNKPVGSMSISPCGRDVVLASRHGLHIVDLDSPWSPPRHLAHHTPWEVADVQWSPFPARDQWVVSTSNQKALVWNLEMSSRYNAVELVIHGHSRALTDVQFSAHDPDMLATCAVDSFIHCWDLRQPTRPAFSFCDWFSGATQTKWNRRNSHIIASSHNRTLHIWDNRKGAIPLRSLEAHDTKIYGIDWSRTEQNKIITCSLDQTIKFWDYSDEGTRPERLLRTPFPVWRARHTPFGHGIVAMPQRGDFDVYLYDCREESVWERDPDRSPVLVETFKGHQDNVKEFLWRPRGSSDEFSDNREFQLVTWGSDHYLRLHQLDDNLLEKTGFQRGEPGHRTTRRGATYKTFRVDDADLPPIPPQLEPLVASTDSFRFDGSMSPGPTVGPTGWADSGFLNAQVGARTGAAKSKDLDPITWMKGVKIGKKDEKTKDDLTLSLPTFNMDSWDQFDNLGEEVSHMGQTFSKVEFNEVDIKRRFIQMTLSGLWGKDKSQAYLTCRVDYPSEYPAIAAQVSLKETTSIGPETISEILTTVRTIAEAFARQRKHSSEAIIHYLQGDRSLEDLIGLLKQGLHTPDMLPLPDEGDSSSDEDELDPLSTAQLDDLGLGSSDVLTSSNANANVPLPKACGALWTRDGRLLCFFPPKLDQVGSAAASLGIDGQDSGGRRKSRFFDGFGRFQSSVKRPKSRESSLANTESSRDSTDSEDDSDTSSSSASSIIDGPLSDRPHTASQHLIYTSLLGQSVTLKANDVGQGSQTSRRLDSSFFSAPKSIVSIHDYRHLLPSKLELAGYCYDGPGVGTANAELTSKLGFSELASAWQMAESLLAGPSSNSLSSPSVSPMDRGWLAGKAGERHMSFDVSLHTAPFFSLLSTSFTDSVGVIAAQGLFDYFARKGDIQMVASLSCALRPILAPSSGENSSLVQGAVSYPLKRDSSNLPALVRHDSEALTISESSSPHKGSNHFSSNGLHDGMTVNPPSLSSSADGRPSFLNESASTGNTPPERQTLRASANRGPARAHQLKPSPSRIWQFENASGLLARAGTFASEISKLSLSTSASPPTKKLQSPTVSFDVSQQTRRKSRSSITELVAGKNDRRMSMPDDLLEDLNLTDPRESKTQATVQRSFKVRYRDKTKTGDSERLLSPSEQEQLSWLIISYRGAYAEMLSVWRFPILRAAVLKHNAPLLPTSTLTSSSKMIAAADKVERSDFVKSDSFEFSRHSRSSSEDCGNMAPGVHLRRLCTQCGIPCWSSKSPSSGPFRCSSCKRRMSMLVCALCSRMLRGKAFPCPKCGHILHTRCRAKLDSDPVLQGQCPAGCECFCSQHVIVDVKPTKKPEIMKHIKSRDSVDTIATEVRIEAPSPVGRDYRSASHSQSEQKFKTDREAHAVDSRPITFAWARESLARNLEMKRPRASSVDRRADASTDGGRGFRRRGLGPGPGTKPLGEWS